jgi:hypothetical protein
MPSDLIHKLPALAGRVVEVFVLLLLYLLVRRADCPVAPLAHLGVPSTAPYHVAPGFDVRGVRALWHLAWQQQPDPRTT